MLRLLVVMLCGSLAWGGCGSATRPDAPAGALRYAVVGDSYSNGQGVGADRAWPALLAERLGLDLVANPAVSGWTTELALRRELPAFRRARPDVGTLLIGVNDLAQGVSPGTFRRRFRRLLASMVRVVGEPRRIIAVTMPDFSVKPYAARFGDRTALRRALQAANAIVRRESRRQGVAVADVFAVSERPTDPSPDSLHPSARELRAWTDAIEPVARAAWDPLR